MRKFRPATSVGLITDNLTRALNRALYLDEFLQSEASAEVVAHLRKAVIALAKVAEREGSA